MRARHPRRNHLAGKRPQTHGWRITTRIIEVLEVLREAYGKDAALWNQRWRMFWTACAELFGYRGHNAWLVGHYRFVKKASDSVL